MDALLPALLAVLLAEMGGRVQQNSEALTRHFTKTAPILSALTLSTLASLIAAGIGGALVAPLITYEARTLLLGLALLITGGSMLFSSTPPAPIKSGAAFPISLWRFSTAQFGDNSQFLVFAIAARSASPTFAVMGGFAAILIAALPPLLMPDEWRGALPIQRLRKIAIGLFLISGSYTALSALRLI
ncbi:MAG: TMEM165/GDT1 family protein [Chakrabartia sp.]